MLLASNAKLIVLKVDMLSMGTSCGAPMAELQTPCCRFMLFNSNRLSIQKHPFIHGSKSSFSQEIISRKTFSRNLKFLIRGFNEHQMAKLKKTEAFTLERDKEIQQVAESVNELAEIMKDLSVLVIDQGTIVDRIDHNIQNVAASVDEGLNKLQKTHVWYTMIMPTA